MEKTHVFLIDIQKESKDKVQKKIKRLYPKLTDSLSGQTANNLKFLFKITSYELTDVIFSKIESISGVISIKKQPQEKTRSLSTNYSKVLVIGLGIFFVSILIATFFIPNNPLETLTNAQILLIEVSIALAVSIWVFIYDRRSQEDIVKVISNINSTVNETNQYVKDLKG